MFSNNQSQSQSQYSGDNVSRGGSTNVIANASESLKEAVNNTNEENSYGVVMSTRPITNTAMKVGGNSSLNSDLDSIQEIPWTMKSILERFQLVASYPWRTGDASHTVLAKIPLPSGLIVNSLTQTPFSALTYYRGDIELRIQVTGTPFHQGKVLGVFIPLVESSVADQMVSNFSSLTVNPCVHLFPNANTSSVITIPYNNPQIYLDLTNSSTEQINTLGYFYLVVMNQLQLSATSSDSVTLTVFSRFINSQFKVPRLAHDPTMFSLRTPQVFNRNHFAQQMQRTCLDDYVFLGNAQSKDTSFGKTLMKPITQVVNTGQNLIESVADKILPSKAVGDLLTGFMSFLDKPTDARVERVLNTSVGRMNFSKGTDLIDKMTIDPSQLFESSNATFGTDIDEMDIGYLKSKFSYLGSFSVKVGSEPGTCVASFPINPIPSLIALTKPNQIPLLSYLSLPFQYWSGGLTYRFEVVATSLQTCKIFVGFNFGSYTTQTGSVSLPLFTSQYGEAFEINQGTNQIELTVPFVSETTYKYVPNSNIYDSTNSTGYLNVIILNPLVAPSGTPEEIYINVYIAGATDFDLNTLTLSNAMLPKYPLSSFIARPQSEEHYDGPITTITGIVKGPLKAVPESSDTIDTSSSQTAPPMMSNQTNINLAEDKPVAPTSVYVTKKPLTVKSEYSLASYLKKYQPLSITPTPVKFRDYNIMYSLPVASVFSPPPSISTTPAASLRSSSGLITHFSALFRQFRGPLRFKFIEHLVPTGSSINGASFATNQYAAYFCPPVPPTTTPGSLLASFESQLDCVNGVPVTATPGVSDTIRPMFIPLTLVVGADHRSLEFEVPFSSRFFSILINNSYSGSLTDLGTIFITTSSLATGTAPNLRISASFGDESRLGTLYQVPLVSPLFWKNGDVYTSVYPDNYQVTPSVTNTLTVL